MKISFLGDISLNDNYIELYKKGYNPFESVDPILKNSDFVVGNLECMAKADMGENLLKQPRLTTTVETLNFLKNIYLKVACLAHNHAYDHLKDGFEKTVNFLDQNGIMHLGADYNIVEAGKPIILSDKEVSIAILNYVTSDTNPCLPSHSKVVLNFFDIEKCKIDIRELKYKVNHIIVSLHWGGRVEGSLFPDWNQPQIARELIDVGADLIIGHHSHTLQPYEIYKGKYIYYSLGNFCFSDVIINGRAYPLDKKRTNKSVILNIDFKHKDYTTNYLGIYNDNDLIKQTKSIVKMRKLSYENNLLYYRPIWKAYFFYEKRIYPVVHYFFGNNHNPLKQLLKLRLKSIFKHLTKY